MSQLILKVPFVYSIWGVGPRRRKEERCLVQDVAEIPLLVLDHLEAAMEWQVEKDDASGPALRVLYEGLGRLWRRAWRTDSAGEPYATPTLEAFIAECESWNPHWSTRLNSRADAIGSPSAYDAMRLPVADALRPQLRNIHHDDRAERLDALCDSLARFAVFNGELFEEAAEPVYCVCTFGLGRNHGLGRGTALMLSEISESTRNNPGAFPVTQLLEALGHATATAERRGDTNSLPIQPHTIVTVHRPDMVKFRPFRAKPQLTQAQWLKHPKGYVCPWCASDNVHNSSHLEFTGDGINQEANCNDCGREWKNTFALTGFATA